MGAVNKKTKDYIFPIHAHKNCNYCCPKCNNDIVFRSGKINTPHFAHKKKSNCCYYSRPSESEIHKEGKALMKNLLDNKKSILIYRKCKCCKKVEEVFNILTDEYTQQICCYEEFGFVIDDKKKYADVALLNGENIKFIFEIFHTHKTSEKRQNKYKWCEIDATKLINETMSKSNINEENEIEIECIRDIKCKECVLRSIVIKKDYCKRQLVRRLFKRLSGIYYSWRTKRSIVLHKIFYKCLNVLERSWGKMKNEWREYRKRKRREELTNFIILQRSWDIMKKEWRKNRRRRKTIIKKLDVISNNKPIDLSTLSNHKNLYKSTQQETIFQDKMRRIMGL
jgi:hypothetical protein